MVVVCFACRSYGSFLFMWLGKRKVCRPDILYTAWFWKTFLTLDNFTSPLIFNWFTFQLVLQCKTFEEVLTLTCTSTDCMERSQGGLSALGRVASQYVVMAAKAPMPMRVLMGKLRTYCLKSSSSGNRRCRIRSWACIALPVLVFLVYKKKTQRDNFSETQSLIVSWKSSIWVNASFVNIYGEYLTLLLCMC